MRNPVVLKIESVSKEYRLGTTGSGALYSDLNRWWAKVRGKEDPYSKINSNKHHLSNRNQSFLALDDISFEVMQGEVIGIIGKNGAGKSTLLKILSRVTSPTKGSIKITGRIASLLEVGTGFHPELTGRENIFLNGAIMGMSRREIKSKFDEIVDFSGVEKFIDTPVKRYSSGMYVRLAFAIAAHLEPEILIVDEVLAVGDAEFQKKCLGKMQEVSEQKGRTVLFVSHQMATIQNLCNRSILLKNGKIIENGETKKVIDIYLNEHRAFSELNLLEVKERTGTGSIRFSSLSLLNEKKEYVNALLSGQNCYFKISFKKYQYISNLHVSLAIDDNTGQRIVNLNNDLTCQIFDIVPNNSSSICIHINKLPLKPGKYFYSLFSRVNGDIADWIQTAGTFQVEAGDFFSTGKLPPEDQGVFYIEHSFELTE